MNKKRIIHLDDHNLFRQGLRMCVAPMMDRLIWRECNHPDQVIKMVEFSLRNNEPVDLLITDYTHPGMNGLELAKTIKAIAARFDVRIPVIMITMMGVGSFHGETTKPDPVIDKLFGKDVESYEFIDYLKQTLGI